jgi:hypothetical protein
VIAVRIRNKGSSKGVVRIGRGQKDVVDTRTSIVTSRGISIVRRIGAELGGVHVLREKREETMPSATTSGSLGI